MHYGCSYFAFCQAVKDHALRSRVVGIDTWKGDPHAGFYDDDVFDLVKKTRERYFPDDRFSFRRTSFDEAVADFADKSIGLLHIDGQHTSCAGISRPGFQARGGWRLAHSRRRTLVGLQRRPLLGGYQAACPFRIFTDEWGLGIVFPKGDRWYRGVLAEGVPERQPAAIAIAGSGWPVAGEGPSTCSGRRNRRTSGGSKARASRGARRSWKNGSGFVRSAWPGHSCATVMIDGCQAASGSVWGSRFMDGKVAGDHAHQEPAAVAASRLGQCARPDVRRLGSCDCQRWR